MRFLSFTLCVACAPLSAALGEEPAFAPGRPGGAESPVSVPAGFLQVESELANYSHDSQAGARTDAVSLAATDIRYGLAPGWDAEAIVQPYRAQRVKAAGAKQDVSGFGDVTIRTRRMLAGADGDGPALAVIGFVTLPTGAHGLGDDRAEGGAIFTGSAALTENLNFTGTVSAASADYGAGRQAEFEAAANFSYALTDRAGLYGEVFAQRDQHDTQTRATFDFGATYLTSSTTQIDAGVNLGVTAAADDADVLVGWAHRF